VRPDSAEPQSKAERKYAEEVTKADEAALALQKQIAELRKSEELQRRHQQQINETNQQINQVFNFWKQNGLSPDQERLLAANPALMVELSSFAASEAAKQHQVGTSEYVEAGKRLFFEHLGHLQEQARQPAAALAGQTKPTFLFAYAIPAGVASLLADRRSVLGLLPAFRVVTVANANRTCRYRAAGDRPVNTS
jgi:hypothetical protein